MRKRVNTLFFRLESLICVDKNEGWEGLFQPGVRLIEENSNFSALLVRQSPFRGGDVCCSCCECCKILGPSGSTLVGRGRGEGLRRILVSAWDRSACSADQQSAVPPIGNRRPRFSRSAAFPQKVPATVFSEPAAGASSLLLLFFRRSSGEWRIRVRSGVALPPGSISGL